MLELIIHISDIHIKFDSYNNLTFAFERLIDDMQKIKQSFVLVIAGDVFENKTYLTTDDIYTFYKIMDNLEKNKIRTIIIPGNHDYNINSKLVKNNIDILTRRYTYIKCISETSEYKIEGVNFAIYSPIDGKIPNLDRSCINVAILHEPINRAKYDTGESVTGGRFGVEALSHWDYVLLGDVHKPQFLTPRIAYSGSFVQKTKGEGLDHGYILWDLIKGVGHHVFIPMAEVYLKIEAENDECKLPVLLKSQKIRYVTFLYKNCSHDFIDVMTVKIENRYGPINKIVNRNNYSSHISLNGAIEDDEKKHIINSSELLGVMLEDFNVDENTKNKILEKHNSFLQNRREINYTNYTLSYLKWSNVLCYGENNYINFDDFTNDFVVLNGNNMSGKSSVIDIIIRVLFNENYRGHKNDIINKKKKTGYIELCFNIRENRYVIRLDFIKGIKQTVQHRLYENGINITKATINNTYKFIRETLGIGDYKDFINMTTALQNRRFLIDMDKKDLLSIFTKILDIDVLRDLENILTSEIRLKNKLDREYKKDLQYYVIPDDIEEKNKEYAEAKEAYAVLKSDEARLSRRVLNLNRDFTFFECDIEAVKKDILKYAAYKDLVFAPVDMDELDAAKEKRAVLKAKIDAAPKIMGGKYDFVFAEGCICCERNSELLEVEAKKNNIVQLAELENFIFEKEKIIIRAGEREKYFQLVEAKNKYEKNAKIRLLIKSTEKELNIIREQIEENLKLQNALSIYLTNANTTETNAGRLQKKIDENASELNMLKIYLKCIDHKKGLPSLMMKSACYLLNMRINQVLQLITDFTIEFKYDEGFIINTVEPGKTIPADMGSGFQKFILDIIMRVVLTNISPVSNSNMIFIDEGFGCLDKENFIHVASILKKLKRNFSAMFVVTHIPELKSYSDKTIMISRLKGDSIIRYGTDIKPEPLSSAAPSNSKADAQKPVRTDGFIEITGGTYKCLACGVERKYTASLLERHLSAKTYAAKHTKYMERI